MGSNQQFSLQWDNYVRHVTSSFDSLRSDGDLVDVTLSCEGKRIHAHKMLLSACSTYFKELFKENPCQHPVIIFRNVKLEDLSALVDFMYQGQVNVTQDQLPSFLATAEMLEVQGLSGDTGDKAASIAADEQNDEVPRLLSPAPDERKVDVARTTWREEGRRAVASSPAPYFPKDPGPGSPAPVRKRRKRHGDDDSVANGPRRADPSPPEQGDCDSDPVEIIVPELPAAVKLEAVDYCEQDDVQGGGGYGDSQHEVRNTVKPGRERRLSVPLQLLGHDLSDMYGSNSRDSSHLHTPDVSADLGQLLQKAGPSSLDNLSQDSLQAFASADVHTKQFTCAVCGKMMRHWKSLALHMSLHEGKTRCHVCHKTLSRVYDLKLHMINVHGVPYNV